jgi:hypothetical protein
MRSDRLADVLSLSAGRYCIWHSSDAAAAYDERLLNNRIGGLGYLSTHHHGPRHACSSRWSSVISRIEGTVVWFSSTPKQKCRVCSTGARAICLTLDSPVVSKRERDKKKLQRLTSPQRQCRECRRRRRKCSRSSQNGLRRPIPLRHATVRKLMRKDCKCFESRLNV